MTEHTGNIGLPDNDSSTSEALSTSRQFIDRWHERLAPMLEMLVVLEKAQIDGSDNSPRYRRTDAR